MLLELCAVNGAEAALEIEFSDKILEIGFSLFETKVFIELELGLFFKESSFSMDEISSDFDGSIRFTTTGARSIGSSNSFAAAFSGLLSCRASFTSVHTASRTPGSF